MIPTVSLASALAASALVSAIWQGVVLAVAVALCLRLLPPVSAAVRSVIWLSVFVLATLLHFTPLVAARPAAAVHTLHADLRWSLLLAAVWLAASLVRAGQLAVSALHLRRVARTSTPVALPLTQRLPRHAMLCTSDEVDRPSVAGFFAPRILMPPALLASLTPAELEQVLLHETEHLRRGDDWTNLLQKLALVVFPLNPVLLWVERRLCLERELACDDRVLRTTAARKSYALCLTNLAEHTALRRSLTLALGAWERQSELARRVLRILSTPTRTLPRPQATALGATLVAAMLGGSFSLAHSPEVISFLPAAATAPTQLASLNAPASFHYASARVNPAVHEVLTRATLPPAHPVRLHVRRRSVTVHPAQLTPRLLRSAELPAPPAESLHWSLTLASVSQEQTAPAQLPSATAGQPTKFPSVPQPVYTQVVTYAAVPFANGWLIIKL